jgi:hypothetical protein
LNAGACTLCSTTIPGCLDCSGSSTCTTCYISRYLSGGACTLCSTTIPGCLDCTDVSTCTTCDTANHYALSGTVCVTTITPEGNLDFSTFNVNVPLGGCSSSPIVITPTASTSNDITLNTSAWTALGYYLESPVTFNSTLTAQSITICSNATATASPSLPVVLSGTNADLYTINNASTANIQVTTTAAPTPSISTPTVISSTSNTTTVSIDSNR